MSTLGGIADAVEALAIVLEDGMLAHQTAGGFTCHETDALVRFLAVTGHREGALCWLECHTAQEDFGDVHFRTVPAKYLARLLDEPYEGSIYDHHARPDDDSEPGDRCKDCGEDITWMGPGLYDWQHCEES